jgi:integrase
MSTAAKFPNMEGPRFTAEGLPRYRPYVKERGKKVRGPWGTAADGKAWLARATLARLDGRSAAPTGETVAEASERFLDGIRAGTIRSNRRRAYAPKTVRGYEQAFRDWINPELGHIRVASLRRDQVQRWIDGIDRSGATVRNTWAALAALYRWLLPRNHELVDPTDGIERPAPAGVRDHYAEPQDMALMLAVLPEAFARAYALAFYAGLRKGEIQGLRREDVEGEWIVIRRSLDPVDGFGPPKSGKPREVPVFAALRPHLASWEDGPAVPSRSKWGVHLLGTSFTRTCREAWDAAGLEFVGLHEARASFATALIRAGYDVKTVQQWVGHEDPTTTLRRYVRARRREATATELMDAFLGA